MCIEHVLLLLVNASFYLEIDLKFFLSSTPTDAVVENCCSFIENELYCNEFLFGFEHNRYCES